MSTAKKESRLARLGAVALIIALYVGLFNLSGGQQANLLLGTASPVFLPAFVRLFGVLVAGIWAIPALFIAAFLCVDFGLGPSERALVSLMLATGAPLAIMVTSRLMQLDPTLTNLTPMRLLVLSIASGLGNSLFYNFALFLVGIQTDPITGHVATFVGDVIGTWVIIYTIKLGWHFFWRQRT